MNCWEFMKCGRDKTDDCPALKNRNGRSCWRVAGTKCGGIVQGTFAEKLGNCKKCDFYRLVNSG